MKSYKPERLGVICPQCGSTNTYERTKEFCRVVLNGIFCGSCGKETISAGEDPIAVKRVKQYKFVNEYHNFA